MEGNGKYGRAKHSTKVPGLATNTMRAKQRITGDPLPVMGTEAPLQLERLRRKKGVSLESIADHTKISTRFLRAVETEDWEKLPGGVFDANYIRQYVEMIGAPMEPVLQKYAAYQAGRERERLEAEETIDRTRKRWSSRWINWLRSATAAGN